MWADALPLPHHAEPGDGELMGQVARGDRDAFARLVDRHHGPLVAYLARLTGALDRGEDLAQEAFLRLYRAAPNYRDEGRLPAYLFRIATNLLRSEERHRRLRQRLAPAMTLFFATPSEPTVPQRLLADERQRALESALAALPVKLRAPLVLCEIDEYSIDAAAALLGCRPGTIKSRLFRARQRLREHLGPFSSTSGGTTP